MIISTAADSMYFDHLEHFIYNVISKYKKKPVIIDLGFTEEQLDLIREVSTVYKIHNSGTIKDHDGEVKARHKIDCLQFLIDHADINQPFIFLDGDCLFHEKVTFAKSFDIGLTFRHPDEWSDHIISRYGIINAGVIFINIKNRKLISKFINVWNVYAKAFDLSDQLAISNMFLMQGFDLSSDKYNYYDLMFKLLNPRIYNDVKFRTGKIYHFRNLSREVYVRNLYMKHFSGCLFSSNYWVRRIRFLYTQIVVRNRSNIIPDVQSIKDIKANLKDHKKFVDELFYTDI